MKLSHLLFEIGARRHMTTENTPVAVLIEGDGLLEIEDVQIDYDNGHRHIALKASQEGESREKMEERLEEAEAESGRLRNLISRAEYALNDLVSALRLRGEHTPEEFRAIQELEAALDDE